MKLFLAWGCVAIVALALAGFGSWLFSLPAGTAAPEAPPVPQEEAAAILASLKPPKRSRPVIAVIGINDATETTDYLMPTGILRRANVADVMMLRPVQARCSSTPPCPRYGQQRAKLGRQKVRRTRFEQSILRINFRKLDLRDRPTRRSHTEA